MLEFLGVDRDLFINQLGSRTTAVNRDCALVLFGTLGVGGLPILIFLSCRWMGFIYGGL